MTEPPVILFLTKFSGSTVRAREAKYRHLFAQLVDRGAKVVVVTPTNERIIERSHEHGVEFIQVPSTLERIRARSRTTPVHAEVNNAPGSALRRTARWSVRQIYSRILPDVYRFDRRKLVRAATRRLNGVTTGIIVGACYPFSMIRAARETSAQSALPYAVEYRDPFWSNPSTPWSPRTRQKMLAQEIHDVSDAQLLMWYRGWMPGGSAYFAQMPPMLKNRTHMLPICGFIPEHAKVPECQSQKKARTLTLLHAGTLYGGEHSAEPLFTALEALSNRGCLPSRLEVQFMGTGPRCAIPQCLQDNVQVLQGVPYEQVFGALKAADVLLWFGGKLTKQGIDYPDNLPAKALDVVGADRRVLAMLNPGAARSFVEEHQLGWTAAPTNQTQIQTQLLDIFSKWTNGDSFWKEAHFDHDIVDLCSIEHSSARATDLLLQAASATTLRP